MSNQQKQHETKKDLGGVKIKMTAPCADTPESEVSFEAHTEGDSVSISIVCGPNTVKGEVQEAKARVSRKHLKEIFDTMFMDVEEEVEEDEDDEEETEDA